MARALFALFCLAAVGCAAPAGDKIEPRLDFGVGGDDLSTPLQPEPDLAAPSQGGDLAMVVPRLDMAVPDSGADDFAMASVDLRPERDLRPRTTCDLSGAPSRLWLAGVGAGNAPLLARFHPTTGWQTVTLQSPHAAAEISLAILNGQPLVAQKSTNNNVEVAELDACDDDLPEPAPILAGATTLNRPALLASTAADLVFRGQVSGDQRLYHSHGTAALSWSTAVGQNNFLTTLNPAAAVYQGALHAVFVGTDNKIYDGVVVDSGSGGTATEIGTFPAQQSSLPPAAITDGSGRMVIVWTQTDTNFEWIARETNGSSTAPTPLQCSSACFIGGPLPPVLALDAGGNVVVAWSGGDKNVYTSALSGTTWSTPQLASGSCGTGDCHSTLAPAISTGLGGDDLELVFVRDSDGKAAHARMSGGVWPSPAPAAITTTNLLTQPALATSP